MVPMKAGWADLDALRRRMAEDYLARREGAFMDCLLDALCGDHGRVPGTGRLVLVERQAPRYDPLRLDVRVVRESEVAVRR